MSWNVIAFESDRGEKPVEEFIKSQQSSTQSKITHLIDLLEKYGPMLGMPHVKKISADLYEMRIRGREEIRIFFAYKNQNIYLLHGFKKKTQKTPSKEVDTALKRLELVSIGVAKL